MRNPIHTVAIVGGGPAGASLAVYLARGRRREALRTVSISLIVVGLLVLVLRRLVGNGVIDSLVTDATYKAAALGTWAVATEALKAAALGALVLGQGPFLEPGRRARALHFGPLRSSGDLVNTHRN